MAQKCKKSKNFSLIEIKCNDNCWKLYFGLKLWYNEQNSFLIFFGGFLEKNSLPEETKKGGKPP